MLSRVLLFTKYTSKHPALAMTFVSYVNYSGNPD
jgi:hypothetical protein